MSPCRRSRERNVIVSSGIAAWAWSVTLSARATPTKRATLDEAEMAERVATTSNQELPPAQAEQDRIILLGPGVNARWAPAMVGVRFRQSTHEEVQSGRYWLARLTSEPIELAMTPAIATALAAAGSGNGPA